MVFFFLSRRRHSGSLVDLSSRLFPSHLHFKKDCFPELYFIASTATNRLYLNKGNLSFADVRAISKTEGAGEWSNAASVVDINNDGWKDIYVSASIKKIRNNEKIYSSLTRD